MAPLVHHADVARLIPRLNPRFEIGGDVYVLMTQFIGAVPLKDLGERLIDLSHRSDDITAATDFLFQGFKHDPMAEATGSQSQPLWFDYRAGVIP